MLTGSILQKLRSAHQAGQPGKRPLNFGVYYKNTLVEICHALEDAILTATTTQPLVIAAFQRGKWYMQEADRYAQLAERSEQIVIMAAEDAGFRAHPTREKPNVQLIQLDLEDPVAQEWHLMILAPSYSAMVLCQELPRDEAEPAAIADLERKFYGFWTFEAGLVQEVIELAIAHIGVYEPDLQIQLQSQLAAIIQARDTAPQDDLGAVVSQLVNYLQDNQSHHPSACLDDNLTANELQALLRMAQIIDQTDLSNPMAAAEVSTLAEAMGQLLDLPAWQINRLRLAGLLHRLSLQPNDGVGDQPIDSGENTDDAPACSLSSGRQALRIMSRLRAIAAIVDYSHECWNGCGQLHGLRGENIPLESRILGLVIAFQRHLVNQRETANAPDLSFTHALAACQQESGTRWDPELIKILEVLVSSFQQGLILSITPPKIAASTWMLNSHTQDLEAH
jgi:DICT domain-containing protein